MGISLDEYRARIGCYNNRSCRVKISVCVKLSFELYIALTLSLLNFIAIILLQLSCDIHVHPGPSYIDESLSSDTTCTDTSVSFFSENTNLFVSLMHLNIQSLKPKIDIIRGNLSNFDILCFTESWLNPTTLDSEIELPGFDPPYRNDRLGRHGGGVIVYCKDFLVAKRRVDLEIRNTECVWIEFSLKKEKYLLGTFYRPPNSTQMIWDSIEQSIELAIDTKIKNILITGDLNENQLNSADTKIKNISSNYDFYQLITEPTSITENSSTLIDLFLTNNPQNITYSAVCEPFLDVNIRYHRPIVALINSPKQTDFIVRRKIWLYNRGDYENFRSNIGNKEWDPLFNNQLSIDEITKNLTDTVLKLAADSIPNRIIAIRNNDLPWITSDIKKIMRKRNRLRRKAKKLNSVYYYDRFKAIRNSVVGLLRKAKSKYHDKLCESIKKQKFATKDWWKLVKQVSNISKKTQGIGTLINDNGTAVTEDIDKANLLNSFFASQSIINDAGIQLPFSDDGIRPHNILDTIIITPQNVLDILETLDTSKAVGPDMLSPRLLKEAAVELSVPLSKLFNLSLSRKTFPSQWKIANVVPVFKKDNPKFVNNYRPISLLCVVSKVFEKCVYKYIHNFIIEHKLLSRHQSGFMRGDLTINQLLYISNEFSQALDAGKEIRVVFFDISKAFDRVWHKGLLYKIEQMGIRGDLLSWIENYLVGRKQKVIINGKESTIIEINAGVPQGSIIGPLFFLIFINDIVTDIGCSIKLFADDTTVYVIIEDINTAAENLNSDLNKVHTWSKKWLVNFNPQKTETLLITRKQEQNIHPALYFNNIPIKEVTSHKHLGLTFNSTCHWGEHIDIIVTKANKKLNILRSLKFDLDRQTLQIMFFSFIRPIIEYGDIIFDNCPHYSSEKLEKINIEAARIVTGATKLVSLSSLYSECGWEN